MSFEKLFQFVGRYYFVRFVQRRFPQSSNRVSAETMRRSCEKGFAGASHRKTAPRYSSSPFGKRDRAEALQPPAARRRESRYGAMVSLARTLADTYL